MTLDEALAELGIDRDASADQARRAYLKLLKVRKPETDPQGFMRLREAYDRVKDHQQSFEAFLQSIGARVVPAPVEMPPQASEEPPQPVVEEQRSSEDAPSPVMEEQRSSEDAPSPVMEEQRSSEDAPSPVMEEQRSSEDASSPADEEEEAPPTYADVDALLRIGLYDQAGEAMTRLFDAAANDLHAAEPPVYPAMRLLLTLHEKSSVRIAAALTASVSAWLRASGQEARVLRGDAAARWSLLRELGELPKSFPSMVRRTIASALLAGDLGIATRELVTMQRRMPSVAEDAARILRKRAPILSATFGVILDPPLVQQAARAVPAARSNANGARVLWGLAVVVMAILRFVVASSSSSTSHYNYTPPRFDYPPRLSMHGFDAGAVNLNPLPAWTETDRAKEAALRRVELLTAHAAYMMGADAGKKADAYEKLADDADRVKAAIARDDCAGARAALQKLRTRMTVSRIEDDTSRAEEVMVGVTLDAWCAASGDAGALDAGARDAGTRRGTKKP